MEKEAMLTAALERELKRCTREGGLVGGVINVIREGKVVYTYHYGYADRENKIAPDQDTLFDVASTSKAWTVMLAAKCVDDGLIGWDDPIKNAIPEFTMLDKYVGEHLSIRDLASHRSGLPGHDFMREKIRGDRENLTRKFGQLEMNTGFRNKYQYNNHGFVLLGYVVERLRGGKLWEDQIVDLIAKPLGIDPIRFRGMNTDMTGIHPALPYVTDGFEARRCGYADNYHSAPCGGIRISMKNMSKWIAAMSRGGVTPDGGRLCSEEQYRQIIEPVISAAEEDCGWMKNSSYAQGWINCDYRGTNLVCHSGGLTGFVTQVGFLPGKDCGYAMSFNTGGDVVFHRIARAIVVDTLIDGRPADSYDYLYQPWKESRDARRAADLARGNGEAVTDKTDPRLVGVYRHPAYETFDIVPQEEGKLRFLYGDARYWLRRQKDGSLVGYAEPDRVSAPEIFLFPEGEDLRLLAPDCDLKLLFKREA